LGLSGFTATAQERPGPVAPASPPEQPSLSIEQVLGRVRELHDRAQASRNAQEAEQLMREALGALGAVLQREPANIEANLLTGELSMETNDYDRARTAFKDVLRNEPSNFRANIGMGRIWITSRYWRQAISFLEAAEKVAPQASLSEVRRLLALALAGSGAMDKALAKVQEAVQGNPRDLDALHTRVLIRMAASKANPEELATALKEDEAYLQQAVDGVRQQPWSRNTLAQLSAAYQTLMAPPPDPGVLQLYHSSLYEQVRKQPTDKLRPGKGAEAAAILVRMAEVLRQQSLLNLVLQEHDALVLTERAVAPDYAPSNVKYQEHLLATYQQLQELTARLVGPDVYKDATLRDRAVTTCRAILALDPQNERARAYLEAVGAPLTTQPATGP
jgi:tetratricopeptide (TPR) repeat protein